MTEDCFASIPKISYAVSLSISQSYEIIMISEKGINIILIFSLSNILTYIIYNMLL